MSTSDLAVCWAVVQGHAWSAQGNYIHGVSARCMPVDGMACLHAACALCTCDCAVQVAQAVAVTPSTSYAAVGSTMVMFSIASLSSLQPNTEYAAAVVPEPGWNPMLCMFLGTTDDNGVLSARVNAVRWWYSSTGLKQSLVVLYTRAACDQGVTSDMMTTPVAVGSATVIVVSGSSGSFPSYTFRRLMAYSISWLLALRPAQPGPSKCTCLHRLYRARTTYTFGRTMYSLMPIKHFACLLPTKMITGVQVSLAIPVSVCHHSGSDRHHVFCQLL